MCEQAATSTEHAPPKCIFPEQKDLQEGEDYRKELITVPSCDEHNSNKSTDDEFLLFTLLHGYFNNKVGKNQFHSKAVRAFERRPKFLENLFKDRVSVVVDGEETSAVDIDIDRFNNEISNICRALYYKEYQEKWMHHIDVYSPMFLAIYQKHENEINERVRNIYSCVEKGLRYEQQFPSFASQRW